MLALAMIVKGTDEEALYLQNCLTSIAGFVDKIFITVTQPNKEVERIAKAFGADISSFELCNDFSKARNISISMHFNSHVNSL